MKAPFIVFEGLEGAGKSTAIAVAEQVLSAQTIDFVKVREPGGTPLAEAIRELIKTDWNEGVQART